jgi:hypothetical protein
MPRYSIAELLDRAQSGRIGRRGLHRLAMAGLDQGTLASSGVGSDLPDVEGALDVRRETNFARAIMRAQAATAAGQQVGAATQARLHSGYETSPGVRLTSPDVNTYQGDTLSALLADVRRKRPRALSNSAAYNI